jgi:RNA polymerase sigma-70 factor (ECF subfamily)
MTARLHVATAPRDAASTRPPETAPPARAEALARRVLALLHAARRPAAVDGNGRPVPPQLQDRSRWDRSRIAAALRLIDRAFAASGVGATTLRAAIECLHAQAPSAAQTDWRRVAAVYDLLVELEPTSEVARERALAHLRCGARIPTTLTRETP